MVKVILDPPSYDIVALEEVWSQQRDAVVASFSSTFHVIRPELCPGGATANSGLLILSRWPVQACWSALYAAGRGEDKWFADKGFLLVRLDIEGHPLDIVVTHLQSDPVLCGNDAQVRATQLDQLRQLATFVTTWWQMASPTTTLLLGDFNIPGPINVDGSPTLPPDDGPLYQDALDLFQAVLGSRPRDLFAQDYRVHAVEDGYTYDYRNNWSARLGAWFSRAAALAARIDYMLDLNPTAPVLLAPEGLTLRHPCVDVKGTKSAPVSDHYALEAVIRKPGTPESAAHHPSK